MTHYSEAKGSGHRGKTLDHLKVSKGANGGHVVEHNYASYDHKPVQHVFGPGQGKEMMAHVAKHMGAEVESPEEDAGESGEE